MNTDSWYMKRCEELALAAGNTGESPVGALIVKADKILSDAIEASKKKKDITCHAEIEAIRRAVEALNSNDLSECTLYSTHEPCLMCSYVIRFHKIKRVVYKNAVPFLGGASSSMPLLSTKEVPPHWAVAPEILKLPHP